MSKIFSELLKRPVAVHPTIIKAFGSVNLGIMWSQLYYWSDKTRNKEGWIHKTMKEMYNETGLSRREQETARRIGTKLGVIETKRMGNPCTVNFRVNFDKAAEIIDKYLDQQQNETNNIKLDLGKKVSEAARKTMDNVNNKKEIDNRPPLEKMLTDKQRHIQIIGIWARETGMKIDSKEIMQSFIRRNLKAASLLKGYSENDIVETIKVVKQTDYIKKFTLETVGKFIDEVVKNHKKEGPRIIRFEAFEKNGMRYSRPIYEKI